jgi:hypothetical protein
MVKQIIFWLDCVQNIILNVSPVSSPTLHSGSYILTVPTLPVFRSGYTLYFLFFQENLVYWFYVLVLLPRGLWVDSTEIFLDLLRLENIIILIWHIWWKTLQIFDFGVPLPTRNFFFINFFFQKKKTTKVCVLTNLCYRLLLVGIRGPHR